jgi:hypothetical protein
MAATVIARLRSPYSMEPPDFVAATVAVFRKIGKILELEQFSEHRTRALLNNDLMDVEF